jgi:hypothetical protein
LSVTALLRASTLGALVVLLLQYGLGIDANLYATLPGSDHGKSIFPGFAAAITKGPSIVIAHVVLGTLLLTGKAAGRNGGGAQAVNQAVATAQRLATTHAPSPTG